MIRRFAAVALAIVLVGAAVAAGMVSRPAPAPVAQPSASAHKIEIADRSAVCPHLGGGAMVSVAAPALDPGGAPSIIAARPVGQPSGAVGITSTGGATHDFGGGDGAAPWRLDAHGPIAGTFAAYSSEHPSSGEVRGIATARCAPPATNEWFTGFSSTVGRHATLYLTNIDNTPATVDVTVWGTTGEVDARGVTGVPVAAHSQVTVSLDTAAPDLEWAAAHVVATAGRVAMAVRVDAQNGSLPLGTEWIPPVDHAAAESLLPGVPGGEGERDLVLFNPSETDATANVRVIVADGTHVPEGLDSVQVPAQTVVSVKVDGDAALAGMPGAIAVSATEAVTAAVVANVPGPDGTADFAISSPTPPLDGPAPVTANFQHGGAGTVLVLSAPDDDAGVTLTLLPNGEDVAPTSEHVSVPAGTTVVYNVAGLTHSEDNPGVLVQPDAHTGAVYVARVTTTSNPSGGSDITLSPVSSPRSTLDWHPATLAPSAGLP